MRSRLRRTRLLLAAAALLAAPPCLPRPTPAAAQLLDAAVDVAPAGGAPLRGVALGVNMNVAAGSGLDQLFRRVRRGRRHAPCCGALSDRLGHPATHRGCLAGALALPCPVALLPVV